MKYQEIAKDMASKINNGFYTDRLPSEADLMEKYCHQSQYDQKCA